MPTTDSPPPTSTMPSTTPSSAPSPPQTDSSLTSKLSHLKASATQQYSLKNYSQAAEFYSEAAEIQDHLNGEMSPENADLLYQYGRCLYHVAVSKSDVLGGKVASGSEEPRRKKRKVAAGAAGANGIGEGSSVIGDALKNGQEQKLAEDVVEAAVETKDGTLKTDPAAKIGDAAPTLKPYFQITGDENWTDSSESENEDDADAEAEEEEDDFAIAYEILDVARVLLTRKLETSTLSPDQQRTLKERLADTHDLQAEISLENERFQDAIKDTRDALSLKQQLYPEESSLIAEAHFKLSLALEFASVTSSTTAGDDDGDGEGSQKPTQIDESLRTEAASEMECAITSCNKRIAKESTALSLLAPDSSKHAELAASITDVKEMVADMSQRLTDLRNPAVSLSGPTGPAGTGMEGGDPLGGILGAMLGESKTQQQDRLREAMEGANDLSGLVKRRKKPKPTATEEGEVGDAVAEGKGKRKAADEAAVMGERSVNGNGNGKKVKFAATVEDGE